MKNLALYVKSSIKEILQDWEVLVKKEVPASKRTNTLVLYDHLPDILEDISEILNRASHRSGLKEDPKFQEIIDNSVYHGRHRASTLMYTVDQVVHEYLLFHRVLADNLRKAGYYTKQIAALLEQIINTAILKSTESFSKALQEMQEKLIGTLAHDIRNPLSVAQLSLQMMEQDLDEERLSRMKKATSVSINKALGLIEGLMDAIRIRAGEGISLNFEKIDLIEIMRMVHQEATEIYTTPIHLNTSIDKLEGIFDETAIRRLIENLLTNAIKYGDNTKAIHINLKEDGAYVHLSVHNSGDPISETEQHHIFDFLSRETRQSSSHPGWGMGLSLVKMVAEAHGGKVSLTSKADEGTTFTITLHKQSNEPGKRRAELHQPPQSSKLQDA